MDLSEVLCTLGHLGGHVKSIRIGQMRTNDAVLCIVVLLDETCNSGKHAVRMDQAGHARRSFVAEICCLLLFGKQDNLEDRMWEQSACIVTTGLNHHVDEASRSRTSHPSRTAHVAFAGRLHPLRPLVKDEHPQPDHFDVREFTPSIPISTPSATLCRSAPV